MKTIPLKLVLLVLLVLTSCTKEEVNDLPEEQQVDQSKLLSVDEINTRIQEQLSQGIEFNWKNESDQMLWSAVVHGKNILTIGYGDEGESFREKGNQEIERKKQELLKIVETLEDYKSGKENLIEHEVINVVDVKVQNLETIKALRNAPNVRYLEPNGYNLFVTEESSAKSSSGCDKQGVSINPAYYGTVAPNNAQVAWNFYEHNIPQAWSHSTGSGITIGLIDTGVSKSQSLLNSAGINDGYSNGRYVQKYGTFIDSNWWWSSNYDGPHDKCGHGTAMASKC